MLKKIFAFVLAIEMTGAIKISNPETTSVPACTSLGCNKGSVYPY